MESKRYFIDREWFQEKGRSLNVLLGSRLCESCLKKFEANQGVDKLWSRFKSCCSKQQGFSSPHLPLKERVFRLFLVKDNAPLTTDEILGELSERGGGDSLSSATLERLLEKDHYYGFAVLPSSISDSEEGKASRKS